ncbi:Asp-tRNA(Asn)/Glu-tRNA(Gln) amidotransferase subunit GatA [Aquirufa antheringensis]|jgi:aspartyl-tRNA(Asn)/glutamyl-tRNA(Gln) amidotransferase subunit A|uniref:Asp-tRNA(Asn)/Glu-tRNA(Gln) amidotransferase subunit GatA n=1 Tax=Aquirufa antheringensis TaxID=2516559 RepID=UPI00208EA3BA|nr:Asp-tRNA(Asn)/Glu-tRNA(Gln) amidotransferase subunit GatA [Aquirufa antheringensis]USQ04603.1 Asp-tRNA(Asn)/Glu-tRNA(Gln) amidotransferase subunit GatA [Aquirufa antheringensis]
MSNSNQPYAKIREKLLAGELSVSSIVAGHLNQIHTHNKALNAFLEVYEEEAIEKAALIDAKIKAGTAGKLAGLVVGIKDLLCYEGHHSYAGSKILDSFKSTFSATAVQRLIDEDAIIIGRQNCDEFGMGSTNENSAFGPVVNFVNQAHVAGGSSGGSAVAVQAGMCQVSLGTDTGGSIRMPAAFCGVIGLKPTYGLVSRWGLIAYASSFDTIGPIANYVSDARLVLDTIKGQDGQDSTLSSTIPAAKSDNKRIAYIKEVVEHPSLQPEIKEAFVLQVDKLKKLGYVVEGVDFSYIDQLLPTYYVLTTAESSSNLSRFDGVKFGHRTSNPLDLMQLYKRTRQEGFGAEVQRRIMLGTFVLSADYYDAYYTKAQKVRRLIQDRTLAILAEYDFIISPTTSSTAYRLGEKTLDPIQMYLGDLFTVQANVAGIPGLSIPMGTDSAGLPMGFQLMTSPFQEAKMLELGEILSHDVE